MSAWIFFNLFILIMLTLDLSLFHRKSHTISFKEACLWSLFWIALALLFNVGIYFFLGKEPALNFLSGYLIEKSLSVDNLFVFLLIFQYFHTPSKYQHRILFWGIIGALIMRICFIFGGIYLIKQFHEIFYLFGAFLVYTGIKLGLEKGTERHPEQNFILKLLCRWIPVSTEIHQEKFFVKKGTQYLATPLFIALLAIETTDLVFAMDSIPAIMAITLDPFIIYTSNVFAILGLRSIFFALSGLMSLFHHLQYGLAALLVFIGCKMLIADYIPIPIGITLAVIALTLAASIAASLAFPQKNA